MNTPEPVTLRHEITEFWHMRGPAWTCSCGSSDCMDGPDDSVAHPLTHIAMVQRRQEAVLAHLRKRAVSDHDKAPEGKFSGWEWRELILTLVLVEGGEA